MQLLGCWVGVRVGEGVLDHGGPCADRAENFVTRARLCHHFFASVILLEAEGDAVSVSIQEGGVSETKMAVVREEMEVAEAKGLHLLFADGAGVFAAAACEEEDTNDEGANGCIEGGGGGSSNEDADD